MGSPITAMAVGPDHILCEHHDYNSKHSERTVCNGTKLFFFIRKAVQQTPNWSCGTKDATKRYKSKTFSNQTQTNKQIQIKHSISSPDFNLMSHSGENPGETNKQIKTNNNKKQQIKNTTNQAHHLNPWSQPAITFSGKNPGETQEQRPGGLPQVTLATEILVLSLSISI